MHVSPVEPTLENERNPDYSRAQDQDSEAFSAFPPSSDPELAWLAMEAKPNLVNPVTEWLLQQGYLARWLSRSESTEMLKTAPQTEELENLRLVIVESGWPEAWALLKMLKIRGHQLLTVMLSTSAFCPPLDQRLLIYPDVAWPCATPEGEESQTRQDPMFFSRLGRELRRRRQNGLLTRDLLMVFAGNDHNMSEATHLLGNMINSSSLSRQKTDALYFSLREVLDNARQHGNRGSTEALIRVEFQESAEKICITVQDEGNGFDYQEQMSRSTQNSLMKQVQDRQAEGKTGGLGLALIVRCCDEVQFWPPGNRVSLTVWL